METGEATCGEKGFISNISRCDGECCERQTKGEVLIGEAHMLTLGKRTNG